MLQTVLSPIFVFYTCVDLAITSLFRPLKNTDDDDDDDDDDVSRRCLKIS